MRPAEGAVVWGKEREGVSESTAGKKREVVTHVQKRGPEANIQNRGPEGELTRGEGKGRRRACESRFLSRHHLDCGFQC